MNENEILNNLQNVQVERKSLPEQVSEQIRQLIIDQNLKVGSKIPNEFELCQQLNVGRGTVREAIKLLVSRNVLEIQRGKGTYVADNTGLVDDPFGLEYIEDKEKLVEICLRSGCSWKCLDRGACGTAEKCSGP